MSRVLRSAALAALLASPAAAVPPAAPPPAPLAARVNGHEITRQALDTFMAPELFRAAEADYQLRLQGLQQLVMPQLIEDEAKARAVSVQELERQEVAGRVPAPADGEISAVMTMMKAKLPADPAKARAAVIASMRQQKETVRRQEWQNELWRAAKVEVLLDPPRAGIPPSPTSPARGPEDAPVTVIAFGDFGCTTCAAFESTIGALQRKHAGKIRVVFRQMPLTIHENSHEAAEMSLCAKDQGKFWELHDWLFVNHDKLAPEAVLAAAPGLGLDAEILKACFESKAHVADVDADLDVARQLGVRTTPTVLVNGRLLVGDAAISSIGEVVTDELRRAGALEK